MKEVEFGKDQHAASFLPPGAAKSAQGASPSLPFLWARGHLQFIEREEISISITGFHAWCPRGDADGSLRAVTFESVSISSLAGRCSSSCSRLRRWTREAFCPLCNPGQGVKTFLQICCHPSLAPLVVETSETKPRGIPSHKISCT